MRLGQLVGFGEKRFSFDLVSRKKPAAEPAALDSVEPFESLILRRMPSDPAAAEEGFVEPDAVEPEAEEQAVSVEVADAQEPAPESVPEPAPQPAEIVEMEEAALAPMAESPAPATLAGMVEANIVSPESVIAALTRANNAGVEQAAIPAAPTLAMQAAAAPAALPEVAAPTVVAPIAEPAEPARRTTSRVKTTFLGFDRSGTRTEDVFAKETAIRANPNRSEFPFGWVVVVDGPGRGTSFAIQDGVSQIGRGDDQMIQLDFGDMGISRTNHAAIAFDGEARQFFLGHGGKANIVRLNGRPVLSTEPLRHGDTIRIGETTLRFIAFCGEEFVWDNI